MSLETKIELLTVAINALNKNLSDWMNELPEDYAAKAEPKAELKAEPKAEPKPEQSQLTHKDLQDACLKVVRTDIGKKQVIKLLLAEFGAKKVQDLKTAQMGDFLNKLESL